MKAYAAFVLALLFLLTGCSVNMANDSEESFAFYVKDGEMWAMDTVAGNSWQITQHMNEASGSEYILLLSENGERIVYKDRADDTKEAPSVLCTIKVDDFGKASQVIASDYILFDMSPDGTTVLYALENNTTEKADLYRYDMQQSTLIAQSVCDFGFTEIGGKPFYATDYYDPQYTLIEDGGQAMTKDAFEQAYGVLHASPYWYDGELSIMTAGVSVDGQVIDVDYEEVAYGDSKTYTDRFLYFQGTQNSDDDRPYTLKLFVKGDTQPTVIHEDLYMPRINYTVAAFTTDGAVTYVDAFDTDAKTGDMLLYRDGEAITMEHGVDDLIDITRMRSGMRTLFKYAAVFSR